MKADKRDSPTLGNSPETQNGHERRDTIDESQAYGGEVSVSSRLTEVQPRNDSLIGAEVRPESPTTAPILPPRFFEDETTQPDQKRAHPSEPTIEEEHEEELSPRETTPLRKFRRLITETDPIQIIGRKSIITPNPRATFTLTLPPASADCTPLESISSICQTDSPQALRKNSLSREDLDVY